MEHELGFGKPGDSYSPRSRLAGGVLGVSGRCGLKVCCSATLEFPVWSGFCSAGSVRCLFTALALGLCPVSVQQLPLSCEKGVGQSGGGQRSYVGSIKWFSYF